MTELQKDVLLLQKENLVMEREVLQLQKEFFSTATVYLQNLFTYDDLGNYEETDQL